MINGINRLLEKWAVECRVKSPDVAGLGYPSTSGPVIITEPSRARMRLDRKDCVRAPVLRASIGGGLSADGKATRQGKNTRGAIMKGEVERVDRFIQTLPARDLKLLTVVYVDAPSDPAATLGVCQNTLSRRLDELHSLIDGHMRPLSQMASVMREASAQLAELSN